MTEIAVDIGGTFTDLVMRDGEGRITAHKASTTPEEFSGGVADVIGVAGLDSGAIESFTHGTTIALNALLEGRGAESGLITTAGFRDVLELMRTSRPHDYDLQADKPVPLIPRYRRLEVAERVAADGEILAALDPEEAVAAARQLVADGCESIAICFLFSFRNSANEDAAAAAVREAFPLLTVTTSAEITREWREFERTSTTAVNAVCRPPVERYVGHLEERMATSGYGGKIRYMQSNGGLMAAEEARQFPVRTLLSGPVGGVIAAEWIARLSGERNLITIDIGGTSADMALIRDGHADLRADKSIEGWPILFSAVDIHAVGTGGGSIAAVDDVGGLDVGPRSAGAQPGPVCYGRGGTEPTVTDAHVTLGTIDPAYFLGGNLELDAAAAATAIEERIARPLGLEVSASASGVLEIVNTRMCAALREVSVRRGHDPREFTLLAYGGGGGLHAAPLARELGMRRALVPVNPGVFSAMGMLAAQLKYDFAQTVLLPAGAAEPEELRTIFEQLEARCHEKLAAADSESVSDSRSLWSVDARYSGQDHTLPVAVAERQLDGGAVAAIEAAFHLEHERQFGYRLEDEVMFVHLRAGVITAAETPSLPRLDRDGAPRPRATRTVRLGHDRAPQEAAIYLRDELPAGAEITGPAIVEEPQSTILIDDGDLARVDEWGNIVIEIRGAE